MSGRCSAILLTVQPKITISTERDWRVQQVAAGRRHAVLWMYKNCCWLSTTVIWMLVASFTLRGVSGRFHTEFESKTWNLLLVLRLNMYSRLLLAVCAACELISTSGLCYSCVCGHCQLDVSNFQPFTGKTSHLVSQQLDDPTWWWGGLRLPPREQTAVFFNIHGFYHEFVPQSSGMSDGEHLELNTWLVATLKSELGENQQVFWPQQHNRPSPPVLLARFVSLWLLLLHPKKITV